MKALEKKKRDTQQDLTDVSQGKKTLTTLFKDKSDSGNLANQIEGFDREIEAMQKLTDLLTIYLCEKVLLSFRKEKLSLYNRILSQIQVVEICNAHALASFWSKVLAIPKVKEAAVHAWSNYTTHTISIL